MAPKRKADPPATSTNGKRQRKDPEEHTASPGRPKRTSVSKPQYNFNRPRKPAHTFNQAESNTTTDISAPRKRGRPPKKSGETTAKPNQIVSPAHGIDLKKSAKKVSADEAQPAKKRGRPLLKKTTPASTTAAKSGTKSKAKGMGQVAKRGPGRPRKAIPTEATSFPDSDTSDSTGADTSDNEDLDPEDSDQQYWLMKAEPNDRFENGHNVKFSIDDLAAASEPERWDGVRNYVARNNMRAMRKGDLAFFYHSNCAVPGIVGMMRIVVEHEVDESAFDPEHPYFDPKSSRDNPKWDCVRVQFVKKFDKQITLKMLNENLSGTGELGNMQVLKQKRLSVTAVKPKEWRFILHWAGEEADTGADVKDDTAADVGDD